MPWSYDYFDELTRTMMRRLRPRTHLDIGCGAGKYGRLLRELVPESHRTGIEIDAAYIREYDLGAVYHEVRNVDALTLFDTDLNTTWDLVTIGDCLEHLRKSHGVDLVNFLMYRARVVWIVYPDGIVQHGVDGHRHEAHISVWNRRDFEDFDPVFLRNRELRLVGLDGYPPHPPLRQLLGQALNPYATDAANPVAPDAPVARRTPYTVDLPRADVSEDDYDYWVVALLDAAGDELCRLDASADEIARALAAPGARVRLEREVDTALAVARWLVLPHSRARGFCPRRYGAVNVSDAAAVVPYDLAAPEGAAAADDTLWILSFVDADGRELYRKDFDERDLATLRAADDPLRLRGSFYAAAPPARWNVLRHARTGDWAPRASGPLHP